MAPNSAGILCCYLDLCVTYSTMTSFNFKETSEILCCPHLVDDMQIISGCFLVPRKCDSKFEPATAMTLERVTALAPDVDISNFPGGKLFFRN